MKSLFVLILLLSLGLLLTLNLVSCTNDADPTDPDLYWIDDSLSFRIAKWPNNHKAAITLTYDGGSPHSLIDQQVQLAALSYHVKLDYEMTTDHYLTNIYAMNYLNDVLIPLDFHFYGHGHWHINHDTLTYAQAFESFKLCHDYMIEFGLKPIAYAYPQGGGFEATTQQALADAGFLSGRLHWRYNISNPYILPYNAREPENWYALPTLVMQDYNFQQCVECVNNTEELIPILDAAINKTAWLILTYHSIGDPNGWGYYPMAEFKTDLDEILLRDFWNASFDDITLYLHERQSVHLSGSRIVDEHLATHSFEITLSDDLPNDLYDQPFTLLFDVPNSWLNHLVIVSQADSIIDTTVFQTKDGMLTLLPNEQPYIITKMD